MCKGHFVFVQLSQMVLAEILADETIHVTHVWWSYHCMYKTTVLVPTMCDYLLGQSSVGLRASETGVTVQILYACQVLSACSVASRLSLLSCGYLINKKRYLTGELSFSFFNAMDQKLVLRDWLFKDKIYGCYNLFTLFYVTLYQGSNLMLARGK